MKKRMSLSTRLWTTAMTPSSSSSISWKRGFGGLHAAHLGDLIEIVADQLAVLLGVGVADDLNVPQRRYPSLAALVHFLDGALPELTVAEALHEHGDTALLHPQRDELIQPRARRRVGVHIVRDVGALVARTVDYVDDLRAVAVVATVDDRHVGKLDGYSGAASDLDRLFDHLDVPTGQHPCVGRVETAVARRDLRQSDDLIGRGVAGRGE